MFVMVLVRFLKWQERRMERKVVSDYVSVSTDRSIDDLATTTEQFSRSRLCEKFDRRRKVHRGYDAYAQLNLVPPTSKYITLLITATQNPNGVLTASFKFWTRALRKNLCR